MSSRFETISFLSDYGRRDEFVGVVHSVIRSIAPAVTVLDITHDVPAHDVRAGGLALARSAHYLVPGVVLAVVDPGVGTDRKPVAVEVGDGQSYLVGPDNGLLAPAVAMVGGATAAFVLDIPQFHLEAPGLTFDGRDIFAPIAAHLCAGVDPAELGSPVDPVQLMPGVLPVSELDPDGSVRAEVLWIDTYGNVQLNVDPAQLEAWPSTVRVSGGDETRIATRVNAFADVPQGGVGLVVDSYGLLAIVLDRSSAAVQLGIGEADQITLEPIEGRQPSGAESAVELSPTRHRPEEDHAV